MARDGYARMNVEMREDVVKVLSHLQSKLNLPSKTAVLQKAVQLLACVADTGDAPIKRFYLEKSDGSLQEIILI